jgi:mannose-6-phosphate isomerase-like protein (cupin superfamily)
MAIPPIGKHKLSDITIATLSDPLKSLRDGIALIKSGDNVIDPADRSDHFVSLRFGHEHKSLFPQQERIAVSDDGQTITEFAGSLEHADMTDMQRVEPAANNDKSHVGDLAQRPWGHWEVLAIGEGYKVKRLTVKPHRSLSMQRHKHRDEHWVCVSGFGYVNDEEGDQIIPPGGYVWIMRGEWHQLFNASDVDLVVIETQFGEVCEESDIERVDAAS